MKCMILKCITNNCKPLQNFDFQKTELPFRFIWFEKFGLLFLIDWRMESIACLLLYLVMKIEFLNIFAKSHIKHGQQQ